MEQMQDNVKTFSEGKTLSEDEVRLLFDIAEGMKNSIPCTACRYCCPRLLFPWNQKHIYGMQSEKHSFCH